MKVFRLLLLYFGYYRLTLFYVSNKTILTKRGGMRYGLCFHWAHGTVRVEFTTPYNVEMITCLDYHYKAAKKFQVRYYLSQLRDMQQQEHVYDFELEAQYDGKKIQSQVGVN